MVRGGKKLKLKDVYHCDAFLQLLTLFGKHLGTAVGVYWMTAGQHIQVLVPLKTSYIV